MYGAREQEQEKTVCWQEEDVVLQKTTLIPPSALSLFSVLQETNFSSFCNLFTSTVQGKQ